MRKYVWVLLSVGIILGVAFGCAPVQQPEPGPEEEEPPGGWVLPTPVWEETDQQGSTYISQGIIVSRTIDVGDGHGSPASAVTLYVDNQVLLSGIANEVGAVVTETNARLGNLLAEPGFMLNPDDGNFIGRLPDDTELHRIRYVPNDPETLSVLDVIDVIREVVADFEVNVTSDPNYAVTTKADCQSDVGHPLAAEGSSSHGEASPSHGEASPSHGEASPFPYPQPPVSLEAYFWQQWALNDVGSGGIALSNGTQRRPEITERGQDVQVIILDTSPFANPGLAQSVGGAVVGPDFDLDVVYPFEINLSKEPGLNCMGDINVADHGLYVAALAHAVAPDSNYRLVRVLGPDGLGDVGAILTVLQEIANSHPSPTVLNLSFGIAYKNLDANDEAQIKTLNNVLESLDSQGDVVTVAAAGNHSTLGNPREPQLPARYAEGWDGVVYGEPQYPTVLAVAASAYDRTPAFYTHRGSVAAPGGGDNDPGCATAWVKGAESKPDCWNQARDFMVSMTARDDGAGGLEYSLGYWTGTSFATPLVTGMAALEATSMSAADAAATVKAQVCPPPSGPDSALGVGIVGFCP